LHETVEVETTIDDIILDAKPLSSLGILINELITNTMKYAFNKFENSKIRITIKKMNDYILLIYSDNGIGIPDYISFENPNGFGLQLIKMLVKQIKGSIILERKNGTQYTIQFIP
jgi:two-component sensor histidine kinase